MSQSPADVNGGNPFDPFGQWKAFRDASMENWSKLMIDFVNSDAYARASAQWLDAYLTMSQSFQQSLDQAMTQTLQGTRQAEQAAQGLLTLAQSLQQSITVYRI